MKSIVSPYTDCQFNQYLLKYTKEALTQKCAIYTKEDDNCKYYLDGTEDYYTPSDIIKSVKLNGNSIEYSNQALINYAVYDLSQRFWYEEFKSIANLIHRLHFNYQQTIIEQEQHLNRLIHHIGGNRD